MAQNAKSLDKNVCPVPQDIDTEIARLKLEAHGIKIDTLAPEQVKYIATWQEEA